MPKKINSLCKFYVKAPPDLQHLIPCNEFFEKNPKLSPPFIIFVPHFDDLQELYTDAEIQNIQDALDMKKPLQWHISIVYLFGNQLWLLSKAETMHTSEELQLLLLETIDQERRKFERLRQKFSGTAGATIDSKRQQISESVRIFVWRRDEGRCVKCGGQEKLEFDHIIAFSKGGSNTERNIQLLCENCNRTKGDKI